MGNGYGNISHKANLKNFLKPWLPTASCIVGFDFFCWLMIFLKQRVFNTPSATETDFAVCLGLYVFFLAQYRCIDRINRLLFGNVFFVVSIVVGSTTVAFCFLQDTFSLSVYMRQFLVVFSLC